MAKQEFSKYERARILGARALQISMDAPLLMKMEDSELEHLNFDPLKLAEKELDSGVLPITVNRPMPLKKNSKLKALRVEELDREESPKEEKEDVAVKTEEKEDIVADMKADDELEDDIEESGNDLGDSGDEGSLDE